VMTGSGNETIAVEAMKRGAQDYLPKAQLEPAILARVVGNAIDKTSLQKELAQSQQNLKRLALYDALTGLGNRNLYNIEIARSVALAKRKGTSFVLLMMDLDKFKAVNDDFGHEAGDAVLAEVGRRLRQIARASDAYFRIGGDEFTAILDAGSDGRAVTERITTSVAAPVLFERHALVVAVSVGMAKFPVDGRNVNDLIRVADAAMYGAKKSDVTSSSSRAVAAK
jgi:diguanylate cyclase (GGDEF)-like protein